MAQVPDRRYVYFVSHCYIRCFAVSYADSASLRGWTAAGNAPQRNDRYTGSQRRFTVWNSELCEKQI